MVQCNAMQCNATQCSAAVQMAICALWPVSTPTAAERSRALHCHPSWLLRSLLFVATISSLALFSKRLNWPRPRPRLLCISERERERERERENSMGSKHHTPQAGQCAKLRPAPPPPPSSLPLPLLLRRLFFSPPVAFRIERSVGHSCSLQPTAAAAAAALARLFLPCRLLLSIAHQCVTYHRSLTLRVSGLKSLGRSLLFWSLQARSNSKKEERKKEKKGQAEKAKALEQRETTRERRVLFLFEMHVDNHVWPVVAPKIGYR